MKYYRIAFWIALTISTFTLAAGYFHAGYWVIASLCFPVPILLLILSHRSVYWLGTVFLSINLLLAALGVIFQVPLLLMITAGAATLACWDLYLFKHDTDCVTPEESKLALIKDHLTSLGLAISAGSLLAVAISNLKFNLPFGLAMLFTLLLMICLLFGVQTLNGKSQ